MLMSWQTTQAREYCTCASATMSLQSFLTIPAILRKALLRGGLNESTLDLLISGAEAQEQEDVTLTGSAWDHTTFTRPTTVPVSIAKPPEQLTPDPSEHIGASNGFLSQYSHYQGPNNRSYSFGAVDSATSYPDKDDAFMPENGEGINGNWRTGMPSHDQRTLMFSNLPERTTHAELLSVIKGGRLLDIYVRNDRTATVSFVDGAAEFLAYTKKKDTYLRTKRLEVKWNDRQFRLPAHVANKIHMGATRNIVVRNGTSRDLTEQGIRDDMEHIHNLVVISVKINNKSGDIFISTNSVHNALFARTCMMSRSLYKGLKIEWYLDECAAPIPKLPERTAAPAPAPQASVKANKLQSRGNLYALLAEDGAADDSDRSSEDGQATPGYSDNGVKINWADTVVVA
jgi:hypothetical protein